MNETVYEAQPAVRFARFVLRWRWLALVLSLVVAAAAAGGAGNLSFSTDYRVWFSKENPQLAAFEKIQNIYTKNDSILFVFVPPDGRVFEPEVLDAVESLTREGWKIPFSRRVDSVTNFQHTRADGDELIVADLIKGAKSLPQGALDDARAVAGKEPLLANRLISAKAHVTGVNVVLQLPGKSITEVPEAVAAARALRDRIEADYPDIEIKMTGLGMLNNAFSEMSQNDLKLITPIMFAVLLAALLILLRAFTGTFATLVVITLSSVTAMGMAGWFGVLLTPPSATAPTIIMTLAIADSVHLLVTMFNEMRHGRGKYDAIVESIRVNMQPVFLTSVTTAIGFLSMNFSDAPPFRDLGNITAAGVMAAFVYSVITLPALMAILPVRVKARDIGRSGLMDRLADFVILRRRPLFWGTGVVIVALAAFIPQLELNDDFVKYFSEDVEFRQDTDFTTENMSGLYTFELSVAAGESSGINNPEYLATLEKLVQWLRAQPEVIHVNALTDTMRRLNKSMHGDDEAWYRLPDNRELAAQYLLLYELSLPFGLDLNDQLNVDKSATRVVVTLTDMTAREMRQASARFNTWIADNLPAEMQSDSTGPSLMFAFISERNIKSMLTGTFLALVLISVLLILALKSLRIGIVSLIPNLLPAIMAFGLWGLMIGQVDVAVSVVAAMSLGIVVDDTIHFLSKYLRARREKNLDAEAAIRYAFSTVGMALTVTTIVLMAGFAVLSLSDFGINARMGMLTAITIVIALFVDFLFLPPLLLKLEGRKHAINELAPAE